MNCKICGNKTEKAAEGQLLGKYRISYYQCPKCLFVQTEKPYWLSEAYESPINTTDVGLMARNLNTAELTSMILYLYFRPDGVFLDYAGGYGIFVRLMRDSGFDFYWRDSYSPNLLARGFEFPAKKTGTVELLTSFESFEHFEDPITEIEKMFSISKNIFFSTMLVPAPLPAPEAWDYYGLNHGQHISLYSRKSLEFIAKKHGLHFYTNNKNLHLFSERKLSYFSFPLLYQLRRFGFIKLLKRAVKSKVASDELLLKKK